MNSKVLKLNDKLEADTQRKVQLSVSEWRLIWRKLRRHTLAMIAGVFVIIFFLIATFANFFSPYSSTIRHREYLHAPPQRIRLIDQDGFHLRPFVYGLEGERDSETLRMVYKVDRSAKYPIYFFVKGEEYKFWGLFPTRLRLFGVKGGEIFLFGTDSLGRDLFSRTIQGTRISLSIGLIGVFISLVVGVILGGISGYFGGVADLIIQRVIEFLISIPTIPLWLGLSAILPREWSPIKIYFFIIIILSLIGWTTVARVVRGKFLSLREEDFVMASVSCGAHPMWVITQHLIPSFLSYLIVSVTLSIPAMILGETALSFLGLGLRPPVVSWGVLLSSTQKLTYIALYPWLLIPALFVVVSVLAINFLGDGLRDAADPYKTV